MKGLLLIGCLVIGIRKPIRGDNMKSKYTKYTDKDKSEDIETILNSGNYSPEFLAWYFSMEDSGKI